MQIIKTTNFDFIGQSRLFLAVSAALVLGSLAFIAKGGIRYGVEFSGGTQLIVKFQGAPAVDEIRTAVEKVSPGAVIQSYGEAASHQVLVRIAGTEGTKEEPAGAAAPPAAATTESELTKMADAVLRSLGSEYSENPVVESSSEIVGPVVGEELRRKAVQLTLWGLLFQLLYIGWRFKGPVWGGAATIAVFHDVIITLGLMAVVGYEITLNVIAALLTLVGYSVNDTIVIFDRVRENLRQRRKDSMSVVMNESINQTLSRTLISNGTTFLTVLGLYLFGGEVLRGFGFAMVVGILVGTYSTIYIASPIVAWWTSSSGSKGGTAAKAAL
jgi:preprotein translocase subunit SecF